MDRSVMPPRPDFVRDKRQERRQQPQHHRDRCLHRTIRGARRRVSFGAIASLFDELEVIVAEAPEEEVLKEVKKSLQDIIDPDDIQKIWRKE